MQHIHELDWTGFRVSAFSDLCLRVIWGSTVVNTRAKDGSARVAMVNSDMSSLISPDLS